MSGNRFMGNLRLLVRSFFFFLS